MLYPHYLSLGTPESIIEQLEMGRSSTTATDKERTICGSLEIYPVSAWVFLKPLMFQEQFKLKYG